MTVNKPNAANLEGFDTYTFPSVESRADFRSKHTLAICGVEYEFQESQEVIEDGTFARHCFYLHLKRLSPSLKQVLGGNHELHQGTKA